MTQPTTEQKTQPTQQTSQMVQRMQEPKARVSVRVMDQGFAALSALPLLQPRRWLQVAACDDVLMQRVDAKLAVETGCHDQA